VIKHYSELIVWQKAMALVEKIYQATQNFPKEELYGLTGQLRRAAISIPSNIAEGQGRRSTNEFLHHLSISYGSLMEAETQLQIAMRLGYLSKETTSEILERAAEIARLLNGLSNSPK
jgi:four helix bundle protein